MAKKNTNSKMIKCILIVIFLLSGGLVTYAQSQAPPKNPITTDTTAIKKQKQGLFGFIKRLFSSNNKKVNDDYTRKRKKFKKASSF